MITKPAEHRQEEAKKVRILETVQSSKTVDKFTFQLISLQKTEVLSSHLTTAET